MNLRSFDKCISAVDNDEDENMNASDLDSDDCYSSDSDSHEAPVDFAERLLNYGIQCRYFWQYNLQSRGPKARRVFSPIDETDFHILSKCVDPVNDNIDSSSADNSSLLRQNRKGSFQPDAVRLLSIGSRIERLENKHKMLAANNSKMKKNIGKEKNKIASRVCRLRRKAQHESNKIKLQGLDKEHGQLMQVCVSLLLVMDCFFNQMSQGNGAQWTSNLTDYLKTFISKYLSFMVAGHTVAYVNKELATAAEKIIAENKEEPSVDNQT